MCLCACLSFISSSLTPPSLTPPSLTPASLLSLIFLPLLFSPSRLLPFFPYFSFFLLLPPFPIFLSQSLRLPRLLRLFPAVKKFFLKILGDGTRLFVVILMTLVFLVWFAVINMQLFGYLRPEPECRNFDNQFRGLTNVRTIASFPGQSQGIPRPIPGRSQANPRFCKMKSCSS